MCDVDVVELVVNDVNFVIYTLLMKSFSGKIVQISIHLFQPFYFGQHRGRFLTVGSVRKNCQDPINGDLVQFPNREYFKEV